MAKTLAILATDVLSDDFDTIKYQARAEAAINDALKHIARTTDIPLNQTSSTIPTVSGTASYALPSDFLYMRALTHVDTGQTLSPLVGGIDEYDALVTTLTTGRSGRPGSYVVEANSLLLHPTPGSAYDIRLRYAKVPVDLSGAVELSTIFPEEYGYLLVCFGRARLFRFEDDPQMADYWQAQFETGLAKLRTDLQYRMRPVQQIGGQLGSSSPRFRMPR